MVAVRAIDEIVDPRKVIQRIYDEDDDLRRLPAAVTRHFSALFLNPTDHDSLHQLPLLDVFHPPESYTSGTLVRFRAMIQDTSLQNEMYLARLCNHRCGGWGIQPTLDDHAPTAFDTDCLGSTSIFWAVSVPGESPWRATEISQLDSTSFPIHQPSQPHKFPIPGAPHIGVRVKIYDNSEVDNLHSTDTVTFVGIVSSESYVMTRELTLSFLTCYLRNPSIEDDPSQEIPVLHVLCYRMASANQAPMNIDPSVRKDIVDWISREALGSDSDAAEWLLLQLISRVHSRGIPLLPPSLTITCFPQPSSPEILPSLSHVLEELLPQYLPILLSLDLLNKAPFLPEGKEEGLHSGYLQLPLGTTILLSESAIQEGKLLERGIMNVRAIQDVMDSQTVEYIFPFSSKYTFHTDLSVVVVSGGKQSTFFQTGINLPLQCSTTTFSLYKSKDEISLPPAQKLAAYRSYIAACRAMSDKVQVTEETSKHIQDDFVRLRQQDNSMTPDELVHLMKVARLLAVSWLQDEVTVDIWEQAKELDGRRQTR